MTARISSKTRSSLILLLLVGVSAISCANKTKNIENKTKTDTLHHKIVSKDTLHLAIDTTELKTSAIEDDRIFENSVNGCFILDRNTAKKLHPKIEDFDAIDTQMHFVDGSSPFCAFFNKEKTQYLMAYQHYGGVKNCFEEFEIGYLSEEIIKELAPYYLQTEHEIFLSGEKIKLGMTQAEVIHLKGDNYQESGAFIIYKMQQFNDEVYNYPEYCITFEFADDRLIKVRFGFPYA